MEMELTPMMPMKSVLIWPDPDTVTEDVVTRDLCAVNG
jgi:hypothetical protein